MIVKKPQPKSTQLWDARASHNLVGRGQRLADVVQHEVRVDALRRRVVDGALVNYHDSNPAGQSYGFNTRSVTEKFSNADADVANLKVNECKKFLKSSMPIKRSINKAFIYDNHAEMTTLQRELDVYLKENKVAWKFKIR